MTSLSSNRKYKLAIRDCDHISSFLQVIEKHNKFSKNPDQVLIQSFRIFPDCRKKTTKETAICNPSLNTDTALGGSI